MLHPAAQLPPRKRIVAAKPIRERKEARQCRPPRFHITSHAPVSQSIYQRVGGNIAIRLRGQEREPLQPQADLHRQFLPVVTTPWDERNCGLETVDVAI